MSDILCRLRMNTEDFQKNIKKSKSEVQGFESAAKTAGAGVLKFAGALGVAYGGMEAFNKVINSTQTTGDAFVKMQDQAAGAVDTFASAIARADFSGFLDNLEKAIKVAGDLSVVMDNVGTQRLFTNNKMSDLELSYKQQINISKNRSKSDAERNAALKEAQSIQREMISYSDSMQKSLFEASYKNFNAGIATQGYGGDVSKEQWDWLNDPKNREEIERVKNKYNERLSEIDSDLEKSQKLESSVMKAFGVDPYSSTEKTNKRESLNNSELGKKGKMYAAYLEMADDENSKLAQGFRLRQEANQLLSRQLDLELEIGNADAKINGSYKNKNKGDEKSKFASLDIEAYADNYYSEWIDTGMSSREAFEKGFKQKGFEIPLVVDVKAGEEEDAFKDIKGSVAEVEEKLAAAQNAFKYATTQDEKKAVKSKIKDLEKQRNALEDNKSASEGLAEGLAGAGNVMRLFNNDALNMAGASLQVISQLIVGKQAEAIASGIAAAFELPFPANIAAAVGVVGTIASLFAQIPAFAEGGAVGSGGVIAGGGSSWADTTLIRANPGEIILNRAQQKNIAAQLSGGSGRQTVQVEVVGKVSGRDLEFVMNKRQQFLNRTR